MLGKCRRWCRHQELHWGTCFNLINYIYKYACFSCLFAESFCPNLSRVKPMWTLWVHKYKYLSWHVIKYAYFVTYKRLRWCWLLNSTIDPTIITHEKVLITRDDIPTPHMCGWDPPSQAYEGEKQYVYIPSRVGYNFHYSLISICVRSETQMA